MLKKHLENEFMKLKFFYLILLIILIFGCTATNKIYPVRMNRILDYHGFSIERPLYNNWYLIPELQKPAKALYYRDNTNKTYSVYFLALMDTMPIFDFDAYAEFYNKEYLCINDSVRFILLENKLEKVDSDTIPTYKFYAKTIDKGSINAPDKTLLIETYGFIKKHPFFPNKVLITQFSERGTEEDFKNSFNKESVYFFNSVKIKDN